MKNQDPITTQNTEPASSGFQIKNDELEGENPIHYIYGLKKHQSNYLIYRILNIFTLGILGLVFHWFPKLQILFLFKEETDFNKCTFFWVIDSKDNKSIIEKFQQNTIIYYSLVYTYNHVNQQFFIEKPKEYTSEQILKSYIQTNNGILTEKDYNSLFKKFGKNLIDVPMESALTTFQKEIFHPFFIFQMFSCLIWTIDEYISFAIILFFISTSTALWNLKVIRENMKNIREMALFNARVTVLRKNNDLVQKTIINTEDLTPGDIFFLEDQRHIPCDCILISGSAMINECSLTGESLPIKKSVPENEILHNNIIFEGKNSYLGTEQLQSFGSESKFEFKAIGLVISTGFQTKKGVQIRNMILPQEKHSQFQTDSYKFMFMLGLITLFGFCLLLDRFQELLPGNAILLKLLDLITVTIPPSLPAALNIGVLVSLANLKAKNIHCISPQKVVDGGSIDTVCFDKTGTLTTDHMTLECFAPIQNNQFIKKIYQNDTEGSYKFEQFNTIQHAFLGMGICNNLILINGDIFGDSMEKALFEFSKANFVSSSQQKKISLYKQNFEISQTYDFVNTLERMSVMIKHEDHHYIYCKGSPEKLQEICRKVPQEYNQKLDKYSKQGFRILALAYRKIESSQIVSVERSIIESDLTLLGFVLLENKLKAETQSSLEKLQKANINICMITGDNINTAVNVSFKCGIIGDEEQIKMLDLENNELEIKPFEQFNNKESFYQSFQIEDYDFEQNEKFSFKICENSRQHMFELQESLTNNQDKIIRNTIDSSYMMTSVLKDLKQNSKMNYAISGKLYNILHLDNRFSQILPRIKVFARISPENKALIVNELKALDKKVAMVGDGANDCQALKQADLGLSLSQSEASIAAHFTSKTCDISSITNIVSESRGALTCAIQLFKFMALYSQIQFTTMLCLYHQYNQMSNYQFIYIDLILIIPLSFSLSYIKNNPELSKQKVQGSLIHKTHVIHILFLFMLQYIGQILVMALFYSNEIELNQKYYQENNKLRMNGQLNAILYGSSCFFYIWCLLCVGDATPFRLPMSKSPLFYSMVAFFYLVNSIQLISETDGVTFFIQIQVWLFVQFYGCCMYALNKQINKCLN